MSDKTKSGNLYRITGFTSHGGRKAGYGVYEDDYSEESGSYCMNHSIRNVRFPSDGIDPEDLNGECIIVRAGTKKM